MYRPLLPCPGCERHVRASEPVCPFCNEPLALTAPPPLRRDALPWPRAAAWVFGTAMAASVGCAESVGPGRGDGGGSEDAAARTDGTATRDVSSLGDTAADLGPDDSGGAAILYGPAPPPSITCSRPEVTYPRSASQCNDASDCVVAVHGVDCCGTIEYVGVNRAAQATQFDPAEMQCRTAVQFMMCRCAAEMPTTQSGQAATSADAVAVGCEFGRCWTRLR